MPIASKPGQTMRVTIKKFINRDSARRTLERLFLQDRTHSEPLEIRSANFIPLPKRRGGCIWTKRPNKLHPALNNGDSCMIKSTPQTLRDLHSVETFVEVSGK